MPRPAVTVDLSRVRANAEAIAARCGVPLIGVVKADAYGLGARRVVEAIADLVGAFYVFDAAEAELYAGVDGGKPTIALLGTSDDADDYRARNVRPAVWTPERAAALRRARPVLSVETGQQRFGCTVAQAEAVLATGACDEAFTHATTPRQARMLTDAAGGKVATLHAAGSGLLGEPSAWLDAVRPGLALYDGAVRVTTRLLEARDAGGPAGYGGFTSSTGRLGVVVGGHSNGLRPGGACLVNGRVQKVREVGMQSAFLEVGPGDQAGDPVVLLGDSITLKGVAAAWGTSPQAALVRLCGIGPRTYTRK